MGSSDTLTPKTAAGDVDASAAGADLFGRRLAELEKINLRLTGLRRDYANAQIAQIQQKADIYNASTASSHGERQGIASAGTAQIATEVLQLKAEVDIAEDRRRFLEFCITYDIGE